MVNRKKLVVISHALVQKSSRYRWEYFAETYKDWEVHLIVPRYWESRWFNELIVFCVKPEQRDNYFLHPMPTTSVHNWGKYFIIGLGKKLKEINSDVIYIVHEESILIHHQIYRVKNKKAKVIFFSMNAEGRKRFGRKMQFLLKYFLFPDIKRNTVAAITHCKEGVWSLRSQGYNKPIYIQTNIGVHNEIFKPMPDIREKIRKKLGFEDKFVIGYAGRLITDKGIDNLLEALQEVEFNNWALLLVGDGRDRQKFENIITKNGWQKRVYITGFVEVEEVGKWMNAMDLFFIGSKIVDSFPLVPVQAQLCKIPVIASDKPALPTQLADTAIFFKAGDSKDLAKKLNDVYKNYKNLSKLVEKGYQRSKNLFSAKGISDNFYKILDQVVSGNFIYHQEGEEYVQWKAY